MVVGRRALVRGLLALALVAGAGALWLASAPSGQGTSATSSPTLSASVTKTISWSTAPVAPSITGDNNWSADTAVGAVTSNAIWQVTLSMPGPLTCTNGTGCTNGETIPNTQVWFKYVGPTPTGGSTGVCSGVNGCSLDAERAMFTTATKGTAASNGTGDYKVDPGSVSGGTFTGSLTFTASN
jgi:hypothetical protein